jgi:hypothetical protein
MKNLSITERSFEDYRKFLWLNIAHCPAKEKEISYRSDPLLISPVEPLLCPLQVYKYKKLPHPFKDSGSTSVF